MYSFLTGPQGIMSDTIPARGVSGVQQQEQLTASNTDGSEGKQVAR